jgi:mevalonate kinase
MMFSTTTYGKWILCGEQSVLRGHPAIVFPLGNFSLNLRFEPNNQDLEIISHPSIHQTTIAKVWKQAWPSAPRGCLSIHSSIPCGQGMGASAALCLAIARCVYHYEPQPESLWQYAKNLEHIFHGQSSGLDILGAGSSGPQWFKQGEWQNIPLDWQPHWWLSPSHEIGQTAIAIQQVTTLWQSQAKLAQAIDESMSASTHLAREALITKNQDLLAQSMRMAHDCFRDWGLITPKMETQIQKLYQQGALAVKPTGSGGGGFLLSLWEQEPLNLAQEGFSISLPSDNKSHLA